MSRFPSVPSIPDLPTLPGSPSSPTTGDFVPMLTIAASDSTVYARQAADVVLSASTPGAEINAAIAAASNQWGSPTRLGPVQLAEGTYRLETTILIPNRGFWLNGSGHNTVLATRIAGFTGGGRAGAVAQNALISNANTAAGTNAPLITISNLFMNGGSNEVGIVNTTSGIYLDYTSGTDSIANWGSVATYGEPHTSNNNDLFHRIHNVSISDCRYGVRVVGASGPTVRANHFSDITVANYRFDAFGIETSSDNVLWGCKAISDYGGADTSAGFNINGGNTRINQCKSAYSAKRTDSKGFWVRSSRASLTNLEAQDCANGVVVDSDELLMSGVRIDTQINPTDDAGSWETVAGMIIDGQDFDISNVVVNTRTGAAPRNPGVLPIGIAINQQAGPTPVRGSFRGTIIPTGITKTICTETGLNTNTYGAEITSSANLPSNGNWDVWIAGTRRLERKIAVTP